MTRLIDADALDESFKETVEKAVEWRKGVDGNAEVSLCADRAIIDFTEARLRVESMPTVDPVRHGRWIYLDKDNKFFKKHIVKCSLCNNSLDLYAVNGGRGDANYCPNCGAKMGE